MMFAPLSHPCGGFFYQLSKTRREKWTDFQTWVAALLIMTLFFNDPLFPLEVFLDAGIYITSLYIIFLCAFISFLVFFWLCLVHECSRQGTPDATKPKPVSFYLGKAVGGACTALVENNNTPSD